MPPTSRTLRMLTALARTVDDSGSKRHTALEEIRWACDEAEQVVERGDRSLLAAIIASGVITSLVQLLGPNAESRESSIAVTALGSLIRIEHLARFIVSEPGAIPGLVRLLHPSGFHADAVLRQMAAFALGMLAGQDNTKTTATSIVGAGAIPLLVEMLGPRDGAPMHESATIALRHISVCDEVAAAVASAAAIPPLVQMLGPLSEEGERDGALHLLACLSFRHVAVIAATGAIAPLVNVANALGDLAANAEHVAAIDAAGAVPPLVRLLQPRPGADPDLRKAAATALMHLSGSAKIATTIVSAGAIPPLVQLLTVSDAALQCMQSVAARTLGRLAQHGSHADAIAAAGAIPPLVQQRAQARGPDLRVPWLAAATLSVLAKMCGTAHVGIVAAGAIPSLVQLVIGDDAEAVLRAHDHSRVQGVMGLILERRGALAALAAVGERNAQTIGPASAAGTVTDALVLLNVLGERRAENLALASAAWTSVLLEMQSRKLYCC
ncbi:hypothetical protein FOA52_012552 [Chlamydomonas sp. UWO 241]|nr:hypothetical protein FOA52_012552 [Chlamydomonas sp. UWO 241]